MQPQAKKKTIWSTFKNAYLRSKNLKRFWSKLDKKNLSIELVDTFNQFINSKSYSWSSKFWRHLTINHLKLISNKKKNYENIISQEYFTFTYFDELLLKDAWKKINKNNINLNVDLFKEQNGFSLLQSANHNLILLLLYENIRTREVFKYLNKIKNNKLNTQPFLTIKGNKITQDDLNSLLEYEKVEQLLLKIKNKKNNFLEIGAGGGRTAKTILSIKNDIKYVIADIPPAINFSYNNLKASFPEKKFCNAFSLNKQKDLINVLNDNDVLFIFPHQINLFPKKTFDLSIAIDCLHEMEKETIKKYMESFEQVSQLLFFKVWEYCGLPYSFYQYYSVHKNEDYSIKNHWKEHFREKCLYPSNFYHLGYEF
jgi:putative sugar O-methyltransferase